ncbi:MAG: GH92 family glycosyl hydrolase [Bacteroides sp.]|nr:GH92 family glycosyl hydrolase [Bacteroides sp.]
MIGGLLLASLSACVQQQQAEDNSPMTWVDPLIGSGGHGHVFVGATLPHGMVQLGPNNRSKGWDWCSGYHDSDSTIIGFAHTHLSGTGIADLGEVAFMPVPDVEFPTDSLPVSLYVSSFSKEKQKVVPGYYAVTLDNGVQAELTTTLRTGWQRYHFPHHTAAKVVVDLQEAPISIMSRKGTLDASFRQLNDTTIVGYRSSDEWAQGSTVYFTTVFSVPIREARCYQAGKGVKAMLDFGVLTEPLLVKTGISYTSEEGATKNLMAEAGGDCFDDVHARATAVWNEALHVADLQATPDVKKIFYTGLYHTMMAPTLFADVDGSYRGADGKTHVAQDFIPHTIFSLWDTYRAVHPLYTMIDNRVPDYVNSLLAMTEEQGSLPIWHLAGCETGCMVGVHSIPVVVDACLKNFTGIDKERAYSLVKEFENRNDLGLDYVRLQEFIPADKVDWSVARALEYAVDDYAISCLACALGYEEDAARFAKRATYYKHYFDGELGFMRGKLSDGSRRKEFDPSHSIHLQDDYVEGNAWQYTWLVPHDPQGLVELFGGKEKFISKLDSLFVVSSELNEGASADITGMIGQYAHGNEPSHHIAYLYGYVGQPWKTADVVRTVYERFYNTTPNGLIGNEDCGQMSAWYIFSTLGFYPVNPVDGTFVFGSPLVDEAVLRLNNGKQLRIIARNNSVENKYIQSISWNGQPYEEFFITYQELMKGGTLEFVMTDSPRK